MDPITRNATLAAVAGVALFMLASFGRHDGKHPRGSRTAPAPSAASEVDAPSGPLRPALNAAEPPGAAAARAKQAALAVVDRYSATLRETLSDDGVYKRYLDCEAKTPGARACQNLFGTALYGVVGRALEPYVSDEVEKLRASFSSEVNDMSDALGAVVAESRDPTRMMPALATLQLLRPNGAYPLPKAAYDNLADRSDPELQWILNGHRVADLPSMETKTVATDLALGSEREPKIQLAALRALGHPEDVSELGRVVAAVMDGHPNAALFGMGALGDALAHCGFSCNALVEQLAASPVPLYRKMAYRTLVFAAPDVAAAWKREFLELSSLPQDAVLAEIDAAEIPG